MNELAKLIPFSWAVQPLSYAGATWAIFKLLDERLPALGLMTLDWITKKNNRLHIEQASVALIRITVGKLLSLRRVIFCLISFVLSVILLLSPQFNRIIHHLFVMKTVYLFSMAHEVTASAVGLIFRDVNGFFKTLLVGCLVSNIQILAFEHYYRQMVRPIGVIKALLLCAAFVIIAIMLSFLVSFEINGGLLSGPATLFKGAEYFKVGSGAVCANVKEGLSLCIVEYYSVLAKFFNIIGQSVLIILQILVLLWIPVLFIIGTVLSKLVFWFIKTFAYYSTFANQAKVLEKPLQFVGDVAAVFVFVLSLALSLAVSAI